MHFSKAYTLNLLQWLQSNTNIENFIWAHSHIQQETSSWSVKHNFKFEPIVLFKIEGNFFRRPNECASFVGTHFTLALEKGYLLSFAPLHFARVNAMEEDPASPKEEHAREIPSSLHSTPQRSHHWVEINACTGDVYFVSAVNTRQ